MKIRFLNIHLGFAAVTFIGFTVIFYLCMSFRELPIPIGTNSWFYGNIDEWKKFGFEVGAPLKKSPLNRILPDARLIYYGVGKCMGVLRTTTGCSGESSFASFEIRQPLYYGQVFVGYDERGIVTSITWNSDIFPLEWAI